jgi:iron complex transport system substrate-binding protein
MKIVTLQPFLAELVGRLGLEKSLCGVAAGSELPEGATGITEVAHRAQGARIGGLGGALADGQSVSLDILKSVAPDTVMTVLPEGVVEGSVRSELQGLLGPEVRLLAYRVQTMFEIDEMYEKAGKDLGQPSAGHQLHDRLKAQVMDWCANFYDRIRGKRIAIVVNIEPLMLGGLWIPGMCHMVSAGSIGPAEGKPHLKMSWAELSGHSPDVLIISPINHSLQESMRTFKTLEKLPEWETISAVKRGQVYFTDGIAHFSNPGPHLVESMGILISALGGMDSGYITPRDCFQRLRWLELQRHKL